MAARIFREGVASRNGVLALTVRISIPQANNGTGRCLKADASASLRTSGPMSTLRATVR